MIKSNKVAIDCGCGAGSDIEYLRKKGFIVYAFDIEEASINICTERFKGDKSIFLSQASFSTFDYPKTVLLVADASLFFCPEIEFEKVWNKIYEALIPGGIFCGSFLGPNDTMASASDDKSIYWPNILIFNEVRLRSKLKQFKVLKFTEHNVLGKTPQGLPHQWHIYSVVGEKL